MSVAIRSQVAKARNGVGAFILQCKRIELGYCDWAGSSRGMNQFLQRDLAKFASAHPQIEFVIAKRPHRHPILRGEYINGREKVICVRNLKSSEILSKLNLLRDASGAKLKKFKHPVESTNESVRGVWSPFAETSSKHEI
ncbi:thioredoxin-like protein [Protomyces lactucae-debilis]|uniref:Large ribosomal subunit protein mL43 n=1 Tax=Protomyces lactucae-debilis TaxID=2754530 RepID=A0A1Y2FQ87_PROLT|nr:thioredoxin-like protein [Protomyces lactucae-debilis]ORY86162.1 thioredoxin-like protein [Protomyces lactucae-debilis]